ncbi:MAG: hypothetical protein WC307_06850 [Candidatus Nanoarchaeia archaeon]|jgi:hypothetical protein
MEYMNYMKRQGLNPEYPKEIALAIAKEFEKGVKTNFVSLNYLAEKINTLQGILGDLANE